MAALDVAGVAALLKERFTPGRIAILYALQDALCSRIQKGEVIKVSNRATRIPLRAARGGKTGLLNLDGGSYVRGNGNLYKEATVSTIGVQHTRELTKKAIFSSDMDEKAKLKVLATEMSDAMTEIKNQLDKYFQIGSDGILARVSSAAGNPALVLNQASNPFGAYLLTEGNDYDIYASNLTTRRGTAAWTITQDGGINFDTETATFTASVTGAATDDVIVPFGVTPNTDSWFHGLSYHVNDSASGTWQGLARTLPYVLASVVDAASVALEPDHIELAFNKVLIRKGTLAGKTLTPYGGPAQEHAYKQKATTIMQIIKKGNESVDLMFGKIQIDGREYFKNTNADPSKVQFLEFDAFGRAEMHPVKLIEVNDSTVYTIADTTTGAPTTNVGFGLETQQQLYCSDPSNLAFIKALTVPTGYVG